MLADKLLTLEQGIILFVGLFLGVTLGALVTFFIMISKKD